MLSPPLRESLHAPLEYLLLFSLFFVALPHAFHLHVVVFSFFTGLVCWRAITTWRPHIWVPGKIPLFLLTMVGAVLVFRYYHRFYGREGGSALFLVSLGLKLMEMKTRREVYLVVYLGFFVAMTQYLFSQSIPVAGYTLVAVILSIGVLIGTNGGYSLSPRQALQRAITLVAQSVPIMLVLFVFFPRIPGPLWRLPEERSIPKTGLSDVIEPGTVSQLSQSSELAFRVDFEGSMPPPSQRYWRGPVFSRTDGIRWLVPNQRPAAHLPVVDSTGPIYRYTITLEPHQRHWVFALELPTVLPSELEQTTDYLVLAKDTLVRRQQYRFSSQPHFKTGSLSPNETKQNLQLPNNLTPRIYELVEGWHPSTTQPEETVQHVLQYFHTEPFVYTLHPPVLENHPIEQFLFETRRGFCEHYATAFVILMRIAHIPARVVTGYQGGSWNPMGRFLEVRQSDAHAWAEVWLSDKGWTRVDPTYAVAPERIEQGIDWQAQTTGEEVLFNPVISELAQQTGGLQNWIRQTRLIWANIDHTWNLWVLTYDTESQKRFWESLGITDWQKVIVWLVGLLSFLGILIGYLFWPKRKNALSLELQAYYRFQAVLARTGTLRHPTEGPARFAQRAAHLHPEKGEMIHRITGLFLQLHYGPSPHAQQRKQLQYLVREFGRMK